MSHRQRLSQQETNRSTAAPVILPYNVLGFSPIPLLDDKCAMLAGIKPSAKEKHEGDAHVNYCMWLLFYSPGAAYTVMDVRK